MTWDHWIAALLVLAGAGAAIAVGSVYRRLRRKPQLPPYVAPTATRTEVERVREEREREIRERGDDAPRAGRVR